MKYMIRCPVFEARAPRGQRRKFCSWYGAICSKRWVDGIMAKLGYREDQGVCLTDGGACRKECVVPANKKSVLRKPPATPSIEKGAEFLEKECLFKFDGATEEWVFGKIVAVLLVAKGNQNIEWLCYSDDLAEAREGHAGLSSRQHIRRGDPGGPNGHWFRWRDDIRLLAPRLQQGLFEFMKIEVALEK